MIIYDFAGVSPNPESKKEEGIRFFKGKWGGEYVEYQCLLNGFGT